jgi:hypothetical protein
MDSAMSSDRISGAGAKRRHAGMFQPGNPGKKPGTRNKATMAVLALLEGEGEALTRKAVELAKAGDTVALRLCLDRLLPKGRAVRIDLPTRTLADLGAAADTIQQALAAGVISLDEVQALTGLVETRRRLLESVELERRIAALERGVPGA